MSLTYHLTCISFHSLVARGSEAGDAIYRKTLGAFRSGKEVPLTKMVLGEFERHPSGLILPGGKVIKRFDGERLRRVAWKIARGLHFHHTGEVFPDKWPTVGVQVFAGTTPPPNDLICFANIAESRGDHPGVFDYKFDTFPEACNLHYWLLLLWDRIIIRVVFHDLACTCQTCTSERRSGDSAVRCHSACARS
jgi:hypothetical protein